MHVCSLTAMFHYMHHTHGTLVVTLAMLMHLINYHLIIIIIIKT